MPPRGLLLRTPPARLHGSRSTFELGPQPQPLVVVIDRQAMERGSAAELLLSLCSRSETYLVGDATQFPNRLEFEDLDQDDDVLEFTIRSADKVTSGGIWFSRQREERTRELLGVAMTPDLRRGIRLAAVAEELKADAFVTADPLLLHNRHVSLLPRANVRSVEEAVALVGLLLRSRGDYVVWPESGPPWGYGRWGFYFGLTRALLPAAWRWFSASVASGLHGGGAASPLYLGDATLRRVHRSLRCRDLVHVEVAKPDRRDVAEEALLYLDSLLVALGGAFDAVAQVAHLAYGLPGEPRYASWRTRNERWLRRLAGVDANLAARMARGTEARDSLDLLATLRNCLHGEALGLVTVAFSGEGGRVLVTVPDREAAQVRAVVQRYPPAHSFGIEEIGCGLALRPEVLCEAIVPWAIVTLDRLMAATEVTRLPAVTQPLRTGPRPDGEGRTAPGLFAPETGRRLRLLAGL
jgi:hypothetical protein